MEKTIKDATVYWGNNSKMYAHSASKRKRINFRTAVYVTVTGTITKKTKHGEKKIFVLLPLVCARGNYYTYKGTPVNVVSKCS